MPGTSGMPRRLQKPTAADRQGLVPLRTAPPDILSSDTPALSPRMVNLIAELVRDWHRLDERIAAVSAEIELLRKSVLYRTAGPYILALPLLVAT